MNRRIMMWTFSVIVCIAIVIVGYRVYTSIVSKADEQINDATNDLEGENMDNHNNEHAGHGTNGKSEVSPKVSYGNGEISIELKNNNNNVPEMEVSHEKLMHLVVVSSDLKEYHHLQPEEKDNGVYSQQIDLPDNNYKVIVDIKPKNLNYSVEPTELQVGEKPKEHHDNSLVADTAA